MNFSLKTILFLFTSLFITPSFADTYAPCGGAGNYVHVGDTLATMLSTCGNPSMPPKEYSTPTEIKTQRVRWAYNPNGVANVNGAVVSTQGLPFTIEFIAGKVSNITVGGESYSSFNHCSILPGVIRPAIKIGDDMNRVNAVCGQPVFRNTDEKSEPGPPVDTLEYTYSTDSFSVPTVVTLQNGVVTQVQ